MPADGKERLDTLLVGRGLARSRGEAQAFVMAGRVRVDGALSDKPGRLYPPEARIEVDYPGSRYVSRGGLKLEKALDTFPISVTGRVCLDAGASTGGFTDCLLQRGARRVYAIDVGYGLLAWSLRSDPRVVTLDRTNARYLTPETFRAAAERELAGRKPDPAAAPAAASAGGFAAAGRETGGPAFLWPSLATCDVSFISLLKVVPAIVSLLESPREMVALVKPQFEAGREKVGSKGVVRDPAVHVEVLTRVAEGLGTAGLVVAGLTYAPVRGPEGNIEYLAWLKDRNAWPATPPGADEVVAQAFANL